MYICIRVYVYIYIYIYMYIQAHTLSRLGYLVDLVLWLGSVIEKIRQHESFAKRPWPRTKHHRLPSQDE